MNALVEAPAPPAPPLPAGVTALPWRAGSGMICGGTHGQIIAATIRNPADLELFMAAPDLLEACARLVEAHALPTSPAGDAAFNAALDRVFGVLLRLQGRVQHGVPA